MKKNEYISERDFRFMGEELKGELLRHLNEEEIVGRYVANIEKDLRAQGENKLADILVGEDSETVALMEYGY